MCLCHRRNSLISDCLVCSSALGSDDGRWDAEAGQTQRTLGFPTGDSGLHCHGYIFFPSSPRQSSGHGVQVPAEPPGSGGQWLLFRHSCRDLEVDNEALSLKLNKNVNLFLSIEA